MTSHSAPPRIVEDVPPLPSRAPTAHKGATGRVAVVAGSRQMSGAAVLCGLGALRGGAGLVRVYTAASAQPAVAAAEPSLMTVPLAESELGSISAPLSGVVNLDWPKVLAVGPGLGRTPELARGVGQLVHNFVGPIVLDADGLNNIATMKREEWLHHRSTQIVITPHPGEMARLREGLGLPEVAIADEDEVRLRVAAEYARLTGTTVVLKGHRTVVCTSERAFINTTGNAGMATGGMGDVLTGLIAALLAQGMAPFDAARLAVNAHGHAADLLEREFAPFGYLAREVADRLPRALVECSRPRVGFR